MYKERFEMWAGKCPRHPHYNPALKGEGGIRAGCTVCHELLAVWKAGQNLVKARRQAERAIGRRALYMGLEAVHGS